MKLGLSSRQANPGTMRTELLILKLSMFGRTWSAEYTKVIYRFLLSFVVMDLFLPISFSVVLWHCGAHERTPTSYGKHITCSNAISYDHHKELKRKPCANNVVYIVCYYICDSLSSCNGSHNKILSCIYFAYTKFLQWINAHVNYILFRQTC